MPELPEVETVCRSLRQYQWDDPCDHIEFRRDSLRFPIPTKEINKACQNAYLVSVERRAKVILLSFAKKRNAKTPTDTVLVHLGMSGRLIVTEPNPDQPDLNNLPYEKHEHARWRFGSRALRYIDPRRFGSIEWARHKAVAQHPRVAKAGVEPLSDDFNEQILFQGTRNKRQGIRDWFLVGGVVAGVGNIYANEACFLAGVRPQMPCGQLTRAKAKTLAATVKSVLKAAIDSGGSSLSSGGYVDGDGKAGWFQVHHNVYKRDGEPCRTCKTVIKRVKNSKRGAFYCPKCQK